MLDTGHGDTGALTASLSPVPSQARSVTAKGPGHEALPVGVPGSSEFRSSA